MRVTANHVFFWGGVFSHWHKSPFTLNGVCFNCSAQYMMWRKALLFSDVETAEMILMTSNPKAQKQLGRKVRGFDPDVWSRYARMIVYQGNYAKFTQNKELYDELMSSLRRTFVEASPHDEIWGIGLGENDPAADYPDQWPGTNWLGQVLTKLRDNLAQKSVAEVREW